MKTNDLKDLRKKGIKELRSLIDEKKLEGLKAKLEITAGNEKNLKKNKNLRQDIAQIKTIMREKEIIEEYKKVRKKAKKKTKKGKSSRSKKSAKGRSSSGRKKKGKNK